MSASDSVAPGGGTIDDVVARIERMPISWWHVRTRIIIGVAWLANKIGPHGHALEPGHIVLAGSFTRVVFAQKGDTIHADYGPLGGIAIQFI